MAMALPNFSDKMYEEGKEQTELTKTQKMRNAWARSEAELEPKLELSIMELEQEQAHVFGLILPKIWQITVDSVPNVRKLIQGRFCPGPLFT